jgi:ribosome-associated protein
MSLARLIAEAAIEKQATDVVILDLRELDAVTDCFVICTGGVNQQIRAIADNIEKQVKGRTKDKLLHREGTETLNWVILDYVNVVAHIFKPSFREFYRLENLWGDAEMVAVADDLSVSANAGSATRKARSGVPAPAKRKTAARKPAAKRPAAIAGSVPSKTATTRKTVRSKTTKSKS